jgi:hypothetical protein
MPSQPSKSDFELSTYLTIPPYYTIRMLDMGDGATYLANSFKGARGEFRSQSRQAPDTDVLTKHYAAQKQWGVGRVRISKSYFTL